MSDLSPQSGPKRTLIQVAVTAPLRISNSHDLQRQLLALALLAKLIQLAAHAFNFGFDFAPQRCKFAAKPCMRKPLANVEAVLKSFDRRRCGFIRASLRAHDASRLRRRSYL